MCAKKTVFILLLATATASGLQSQTAPTQQELNQRMTANQRNFASYDLGEDLRQRAKSDNADVSRTIVTMSPATVCTNCPKSDPNANPFLRRLAESSDLVVTGKVISNTAGLTANHAFVFTDSQFVIDQVLKAEAGGPGQGKEITITRPGGTVFIDGHRISVLKSDERRLLVGHSYILFLKYLTNSASYKPISPFGFDISGPSAEPLLTSEQPPNGDLLGSTTAFLQSLKNSLTASSQFSVFFPCCASGRVHQVTARRINPGSDPSVSARKYCLL